MSDHEIAARLLCGEARHRLAREYGMTEYEIMERVMSALWIANRSLVEQLWIERGLGGCLQVPLMRRYKRVFLQSLSATTT